MPGHKKTTVHLLHGFIGSGKTTLAKRLGVEIPAVRFTLDEWMVSLHGHSPPEEHFPDYFARIESLIWALAKDVVRVQRDIILDFGFWSRESRDLARERTLSMGAIPKFYAVSCPPAVMKARTLERSANLPKDALWIDERAFETLWGKFEPIGSDEECVHVDGFT